MDVVKQKTFSNSCLGDTPVHIAIDDLNGFLLENKITPDRIISITKDYGYPNKLDLFYHDVEERKEEDKKEEERMFYSNGWNDFGFRITKHILSIDSNFPQNKDELIVRLGLMSYRDIIETKDSL